MTDRAKTPQPKFRVGDLVEVRSAEEILLSLDGRGALGRLPFMPEMLQFCGRRFTVVKRAEKACTSADGVMWQVQGAVHLDNARCDGSAHGGCEAGCLLLDSGRRDLPRQPAWLLSPHVSLVLAGRLAPRRPRAAAGNSSEDPDDRGAAHGGRKRHENDADEQHGLVARVSARVRGSPLPGGRFFTKPNSCCSGLHAGVPARLLRAE